MRTTDGRRALATAATGSSEEGATDGGSASSAAVVVGATPVSVVADGSVKTSHPMPTPMTSTTRYVTIVAHTPFGRGGSGSCGGDKGRVSVSVNMHTSWTRPYVRTAKPTVKSIV